MFFSYGCFPLLCYCKFKLNKVTFENAPTLLIPEFILMFTEHDTTVSVYKGGFIQNATAVCRVGLSKTN